MSRIPSRHRARMPALALLALLATPAFAGTPIDQTRPLDPRGRIEIENLKGQIQVRAWDRNEVHIGGSLGKGVEKLVFDGDRSHLEIRVEYPNNSGWGRRDDKTEPTTLLIQVPLQATLDVESVSANIDIDGVAPGELEVESVSGDIVIAAAPGQADISSVSGNQRLTLNSTGNVSAESVSGDISLRGRLAGELRGETVSGNLEIASNGQAVRRLSLSSVSGDATARIAMANGGEIKAETVSGDIDLHLPKGVSARVEAESFSGDLRAPGASVKKEEFGPGSSMNTRYGSGAGQVRVETFSGDFNLTLD